MPVVDVDDVRFEVLRDIPHGLENRLREEGDSLRVVVFTVYLVALEVVLIVKEVVLDASPHKSEEAAVLAPPSELDIIVCLILHLVSVLLWYGAQKRKYAPAVELI